MIIDLHTHVLDFGHWASEWWDWVAKDWASKKAGRDPSKIREKIESGLVDPDGSRMVAHMDAAGVDKAVILPIDWGPDYHCPMPYEEMVAHAAQCAKRYPDRLIPFAGIDPRRPKAAETLDAWLSSGIYKGLKLYPNCGFYADDDVAMPLYEVCDAHNVPILFHTGHPLPVLDFKYSDPQHFMRVVTAFPRLKVILGHAGTPHDWEAMIALVEASEAAVMELSLCVWHDACEEEELELARKVCNARDRVGIERIVFGSDHVSGSRIRPPGALNEVVEQHMRMPATALRVGGHISPEEHEMIMYRNAARLLGLTEYQ
jgi:uncharacterized protein